jgi:hypothetical protein
MKSVSDKAMAEMKKKSITEFPGMTVDEAVHEVIGIFKKEGLKERIFIESISKKISDICESTFDDCDVEQIENGTILTSGKEKFFEITFKMRE